MPADRDRPDEDLDAAFAAIISGWDDIPSLDDGPGTPGAADTPAEPDADTGADPPRRRATDAPASRGDRASEPTGGPRDWVAPDDPDDDRYHPPDPPPLPRGDLVGLLAWAGVLLGPGFLVGAGLFWRSAPHVTLALAVLAFVAGFVTLVLRLPADRDDSDGDDGAVV